MDAASNGQGIALAPSILLGSKTDHNKLIKVWEDEQNDQGGYYIVYPKNAKTSMAREALKTWFLDEVDV